jgi:hypothetical protein
MARPFLQELKTQDTPTTCAKTEVGAFILPSSSSAQLYSTLRYFPPPKPCSARQRACDSSACRLLTAASVNGRRTVVRPLQTARSAHDADDNRTALYAPPTARFTDLGMPVSLPTFIQ